MATFVIVHGAWSGAHAWRWVVPQPLATMTQPYRITTPAAALPPRTFILCTEGKDGEPTPPHVARIAVDPDWKMVTLAATHTAHVMAPDAVAAALLALVPETVAQDQR